MCKLRENASVHAALSCHVGLIQRLGLGISAAEACRKLFFVEGTSHIRTDQASQISEGTIKVKAAKFGRVIPMCLALSHEGPRKLVDHRCKRNRRNRSRPENQVIRPRCGRAAALDASARKGVCQGRPLALGVWELSDSRNLYPSGFGGFHISVCNLCGGGGEHVSIKMPVQEICGLGGRNGAFVRLQMLWVSERRSAEHRALRLMARIARSAVARSPRPPGVPV